MNKRLYIPLDCFLDTRLGTLFTINPEAHAHVIAHPAYWEREHTNWPNLTNGMVSNETFNERYAKRDMDVLQNSIITNIVPVINQVLATYEQAMVDRITTIELSVEINLWPYELNDGELEVLQGIMRQILGQELVILFCSTPLDELTPQALVERYTCAFMFDFQDWIKQHAEAFYKLQANRFVMIVPRLFETDPKGLNIEQKQNELQRFRFEHLQFLDFEFIHVQNFSMLRPNTK